MNATSTFSTVTSFNGKVMWSNSLLKLSGVKYGHSTLEGRSDKVILHEAFFSLHKIFSPE